MKRYKINKKRILIQSLQAFIGYVIGVIIVLQFFTNIDFVEFLIGSLLGCTIAYFLLVYPRDILVDDEHISFICKKGISRKRIRLKDIAKIEVCKQMLYNSICIITADEKKYKIYPQDVVLLYNNIAKEIPI